METAGLSYSRGPLSLEMGAITGAVDDLVSGYESLVNALPDVSQRVHDMQNGTEDMAKRLEDRMRYLIDGYEYLDSVSAQIPPALQKMASAHRQSLMDAAEVLGTVDKQDLLKHERDLQNLKGELKSIAYERTVMDVLTRQAIRESKQKHGVQSHRQAAVVRSRFNSAPGRYPPSVPQKSGAASASPSSSKTESGAAAQDANAPIRIEKFSSSFNTPPSAQKSSGAPGGHTNRISPQQKAPQRYDIFSVQSPAGATVVPSVKTGVLPPELRQIKSVPSSAVIGGTRKRKIPKNLYPARKRSTSANRQKSRSPEKVTLKRNERNDYPTGKAMIENLKNNIEQSADQLADMKNRLENAETRRVEDQEYTDRKLDEIKDLLHEKEKENRQMLEDVKAKAARLGKKRIVVETIEDDFGPVKYKIVPVSSVVKPDSESTVNEMVKAPPIERLQRSEIAVHDPPENSVVSLPRRRELAPVSEYKESSCEKLQQSNCKAVTSRGDGELIVIAGGGKGHSEIQADHKSQKALICIADPVGNSQRDRFTSIGNIAMPAPLPKLADQNRLFSNEPQSQHNRPIQPWVSRVKMTSANSDGTHSDNNTEFAHGGALSVTEVAPPPERDRVDVAAEDVRSAEAANDGWVSAHYPPRPVQQHRSAVEDTLLDLVKGMVAHQQSTIESQAELMKAVLLAAEKNSEGTIAPQSYDQYLYHENGNDSNQELQAEDIDGESETAVMHPNVRSVQDVEAEPPRKFKTAFGRLLALGPDFLAGSNGVDSSGKQAGSSDVLNTLYTAASVAVVGNKIIPENVVNDEIAAVSEKRIASEKNASNVIRNRGAYPGVEERGSSRLASLPTVQSLSNQADQNSSSSGGDACVVTSPLTGPQFVQDVLHAIYSAAEDNAERSKPNPRVLTNPHIKTPGIAASRNRNEKIGLFVNDNEKATSDPRSLEHYMIEQCVERAVRAVLPPHLINHNRPRIQLNDDLGENLDSEARVMAQDTDDEWLEHDKKYSRNDIKHRPTGGFKDRVRADLSGHQGDSIDPTYYFDEPGTNHRTIDLAESKLKRKVVAGPGGLVYYGQRDGWAQERCADENEYQSHRQSKIPYQRYLNRNGMNNHHDIHSGAEEHYRGSDEDGYDDKEIDEYPARAKKVQIQHKDADAAVLRRLKGSSLKSAAQPVCGSSDRPNNSHVSIHDIVDVVRQDMEELKAHRKKQQEDDFNDTRSSISEYSSGGERGGILVEKKSSRIPQEAIELDYIRRANQSKLYSTPEKKVGRQQEDRYTADHTRRPKVPTESALGIPIPLMSRQLGHEATAEVVSMAGRCVTVDTYVSTRDHSHQRYPSSSDSEDEKNVPYPMPFKTEYSSIPARRREVAGRNQVQPRSRFLRNLQPVSDDSSFADSLVDSFDEVAQKAGNHAASAIKSKYQYLGNKERAYQTRELISNCSTGTPASSFDSVHKNQMGRPARMGDNNNEPRKSADSESTHSRRNSARNDSSDVETKPPINDDIVRQPKIFISKLKLGPSYATSPVNTDNSGNSTSRSSISSGANTIDRESTRYGGQSDPDTMYYSSMESDVSVSSTSQSMRMYSRC